MNGFLKGGLIVTAIAIPIILFWSDLKQIFDDTKLPVVAAANVNGDEKDKDKKDKKKKDNPEGDEVPLSTDVRVVQKWEMPSQLTEISGVAYLRNNQFACIQDELGTIFI